MSFHATAAGFSARPNTLSTFRNHLLCSVCAALLVMGSSAMAQEAPPVPEKPAEAKARILVKTGEIKAAVAADKDESFTIETGGMLKIWDGGLVKDALVEGVAPRDANGLGVGGVVSVSGAKSNLESATINLGGLIQVLDKARVGTVTVNTGGRLGVDAGGKADSVTVNKDGKLDVLATGRADNVLLHGGYASTAGHIGIATVNKGQAGCSGQGHGGGHHHQW